MHISHSSQSGQRKPQMENLVEVYQEWKLPMTTINASLKLLKSKPDISSRLTWHYNLIKQTGSVLSDILCYSKFFLNHRVLRTICHLVPYKLHSYDGCLLINCHWIVPREHVHGLQVRQYIDYRSISHGIRIATSSQQLAEIDCLRSLILVFI